MGCLGPLIFVDVPTLEPVSKLKHLSFQIRGFRQRHLILSFVSPSILTVLLICFLVIFQGKLIEDFKLLRWGVLLISPFTHFLNRSLIYVLHISACKTILLSLSSEILLILLMMIESSDRPTSVVKTLEPISKKTPLCPASFECCHTGFRQLPSYGPVFLDSHCINATFLFKSPLWTPI